jgi:hypothetical protein
MLDQNESKYKYHLDQKGQIGWLDKGPDQGLKLEWTIVSMTSDWKVVY